MNPPMREMKPWKNNFHPPAPPTHLRLNALPIRRDQKVS
jgi:hypothetical protein